ncbi:MAG: gamma-glutamyl-gamma-aminobutyrate hydrolase family protein [Myxococcales bacterium]|nr:gamma-glutamyl-gamma-aminobutyrate hydrolase family protein [Myxococcales bacterium]
MRPLIGIPPCLDDRGRWRPSREYHYVDAAYADAITEAGGTPVYLPAQSELGALVERLDGLLLPGGDDFPPEGSYPSDVRFDPAPARQIAFDRALLGAALERDRPVLGICYGMQLLALHAGGALHFDLATDLAGSDPHQLTESDARHPIRVEAGSRLAALLASEVVPVNSRHHQAVSDAGAARVSARANDGVIEAIEVPEARFAIGVQWHPESMEPEHRALLFRPFVNTCAGDGETATR